MTLPRIFTDETAARRFLEAQRWPDGPVCPFCGQFETVHSLPAKGSMGAGWYHCRDCRKKFTVRVGTLYERSHVPLHVWLYATHLLCSSKKGMSAHQLHRMLGVTYKTAWFMAHRIREGMADKNPEPMGGPGNPVEADETYYGYKDKFRGKDWSEKKGHRNMRPIVTLVSGGKARSFSVEKATAEGIRDILVTNARREAELHTDESRFYQKVGREFADHKTVVHTAGEYVGKDGQTSNHVENYYSVFKRGMRGVYQHCSEKHLQRYLNEFDFRYSNRSALGVEDAERTVKALKGIEGKRLTYRRTNQAANA